MKRCTDKFCKFNSQIWKVQPSLCTCPVCCQGSWDTPNCLDSAYPQHPSGMAMFSTLNIYLKIKNPQWVWGHFICECPFFHVWQLCSLPHWIVIGISIARRLLYLMSDDGAEDQLAERYPNSSQNFTMPFWAVDTQSESESYILLLYWGGYNESWGCSHRATYTTSGSFRRFFHYYFITKDLWFISTPQ